MNQGRREAAERALAKVAEAAEIIQCGAGEPTDRELVVLLALSIAATDLRIVLGMTRSTSQMERVAGLMAHGLSPEMAADVVREGER